MGILPRNLVLTLIDEVNDGTLPFSNDTDLNEEYFFRVNGMFADVEKTNRTSISAI
jgi:hypothetical protein